MGPLPSLLMLDISGNEVESLDGLAAAAPLLQVGGWHEACNSLCKATNDHRTACSLCSFGVARNSMKALLSDAKPRSHWLQVLVASRNRVTSLPPCLHLPLLRELGLSGNRLSSVAAWPWLPSLQLLQLEDNQLAQLAPMQARRSLPECLAGVSVLCSGTRLQ